MCWLQEVIPKGLHEVWLKLFSSFIFEDLKKEFSFVYFSTLFSECDPVSSVYVYLCVFMLYFLVLSGS